MDRYTCDVDEVKNDYDALQNLWKTRRQQLANLKKELSTQKIKRFEMQRLPLQNELVKACCAVSKNLTPNPSFCPVLF